MKQQLYLLRFLFLITLLGVTASTRAADFMVDGGTISTSDNQTVAYACPNDVNADIISFINTSTQGDNYRYVVTDINNVIIGLPPADMVDFNPAGPGVCLVYGVSFNGNFSAMMGDNILTTNLSDDIWDLSDNTVTVNRGFPDGASVFTLDGSPYAFTCPGDGNADIVNFSNNSQAGILYGYVVTNDDFIILDITDQDNIDFEGAGLGESLVWGFSYVGNLRNVIGESVLISVLTDDCFNLSDNFVRVFRDPPTGGSVSLTGGDTSISICTGDDETDLLSFENNSASTADYNYLVTDDNNNILIRLTSNSLDFSAAASGICRIWGLSFTGNYTAMEGDDAASVALSDGCFELSSNFITVDRTEVNAGVVSIQGGGLEAFFCAGDGTDDILSFEVNGQDVVADFTYVITDSDLNILALPAGNIANFDGAGAGLCYVWGLSYSGNITAMVGDNAGTTALTDACYNLSDNFISVYRTEMPDGATVTSTEGDAVYTCPNDMAADLVTMENSSNENANYLYVVTNNDDLILTFFTGTTFDFNNSTPGICRIYGVSFGGNSTVTFGENINSAILSDDCFDVSDNYVTVFKDNPDGAMVTLENGTTEVSICAGDGISDPLTILNNSQKNTLYGHVITDPEGFILGLVVDDIVDLESAGPGTCYIYGVSYTGELRQVTIGENIETAFLSDDCYNTSDNFILVNRSGVDAGMVFTAEGDSERTICVGTGAPATVAFTVVNTNDDVQYVVTDTDNIILSLPMNNMADFDGAGLGACRVWSLAFTGMLTVTFGDNIATMPLSDGCYSLSENFVTINRIGNLDAGVVSTMDGETEITRCVGTGSPVMVSFMGTSMDPNVRFVVTDEENNILGFPSGNTVDFADAGSGGCRLWALSYTGNLLAMVGDNAVTTALSDGCYELSANFVHVNRTDLTPGTVSTQMGDPEITICVGTGSPVTVDFTTANTTDNIQYVVTDADNTILDLPSGDIIDFDGAGSGTCRVWALSYTGNLTATVGDNAATATLTDGCFELSTNFVTVNRSDEVDAGTLATMDGETELSICNGTGEPILVSFTGTSMDENARFIVTDNDNTIIGLPMSNTVDFDGAGSGICRVWVLSHTGTFSGELGQNILTDVLASECYEVSTNWVTIDRTDLDPGSVSTTDGETELNVCVGDGAADLIEFMGTSSDDNIQYVVTDADNNILGLPPGNIVDFEDAGFGACRLWSLSYTGNISAMIGDNVATTTLTDGCFELSENFVTVTRDTTGSLCVTGTNDLEPDFAALIIQPNPATTILTVRIETVELEVSQIIYQIFNVAGQRVHSESGNLRIGETVREFYLDEFAEGMYFLRMETGGKVMTRRFVKM